MSTTELPNGWKEVTIGDIAELVTSGATPTVGRAELYSDENHGVPFFRIQNVNLNRLILSDLKYVTQEVHNKHLKRSQIRPNDVLMTITGRLGTAAVVPPEIREANINQHICLIRPKGTVADPHYIAFHLNSKETHKEIMRKQHGATRIALNHRTVGSLTIKLPPINIQRKIATILQRSHRLIKTREQVNQLTNKIIQSVFLKMFGDPATNPMGWKVKRIGDLIKITSGDYFKLREYSDHGIRLLKINNVYFGRIIWDEVSYLPEEYADKFKHLVLKEGDILIALNRPIIRNRLKFGMLRKSDAPSILYQRVGRLDVLDESTLDRRFLFGFISTPQFLESLSAKLTGSDQPYINPTQLVKINMYVPPINLQKKFAVMFEILKSTEDKQERSTQEISELFHFLMQRAFTGRLVS